MRFSAVAIARSVVIAFAIVFFVSLAFPGTISVIVAMLITLTIGVFFAVKRLR